MSQPLLTLRPTGLAVGDVAELLCEAQSGSPPVLYSFYLNGEMLGNRVAPCGRAASLLFRVTSERDAGNYSCAAENSVSKETSKPGALSLDGKSCSQPGPGPQSCRGQTSLLCVPPAMPGTVLGTEQALGDQQGMDLLGVSVQPTRWGNNDVHREWGATWSSMALLLPRGHPLIHAEFT